MRNPIIPTFTMLFLTLLSCNSQNLNPKKENSRQYTQEELQAIIDKYDLYEGTIKWQPVDSLPSSDLFQPQMTLQEFEEMVANEAAYQKSKEGRIARKINEFYRSFTDSIPTEKQEKTFFKKLDEEFGTNLYEKSFNKPALKPGEIRISYKNVEGKETSKKEVGPPLKQE